MKRATELDLSDLMFFFESTGNPEAVENALKYLKHGGKLVIFGCFPMNKKFKYHHLTYISKN